ncbi:MAG: hypothetical protein LBR80_14605 [Deltaproteobacteria bacterium]|nr:hypothetical protein [Deltaproteobacteria bacterium]
MSPASRQARARFLDHFSHPSRDARDIWQRRFNKTRNKSAHGIEKFEGEQKKSRTGQAFVDSENPPRG